MEPRQLTRLLAYFRIAAGVALFAAPRTAAKLWLGREIPPAAGPLARGMGARDLAIGVGQLVTIDDDGRDPGPWLDAAIASDAADAAAAVLARRALPARVVVGTAIVALGAAAGGLALKQALAESR